MIKHLIIWLVSFSGTGAWGTDVYALIQSGRLKEASDSLSRLSTASRRDGNTVFFGSLLESDAEKAAQLMEAALEAAVDPVYQEEIYYRLAQYYFIRGNSARVAQLILDYLSRWEEGRYRGEMQRLSAAVEPETAGYDAAVQAADRYLAAYPRGEQRQWGQVDKARVMLASGKRVAALDGLKALSREKSGPGVPQALYLLGMEAVKRGRTDEATFYYGLLRDAYPRAVGLDALMDRISSMSSGDSKDVAAEKITGTYYSVQVGVFAGKENARSQADVFKKYGKPVDIALKEIAGVTYRVVYVGHFDSYADAAAFKRTLEAAHNEVFQVVAR
jgi:tetratricopeptide (TPR) repeat protein